MPFALVICNGVWCNVSIRVLGTRGDSSTLSSPKTFPISNCRLPIGLRARVSCRLAKIGNRQLEIGNSAGVM
jgi:hypothetical protein